MSPKSADTIVNGIGTGPSWYDAWEMHRSMEKSFKTKAELIMSPARAGNGKYGWRITARLESNPKVFGCGCFGPAFPGTGQKSFAAATYRALLALDEEMAKFWLDEYDSVDQQADADSDAL